MINHGINLGKRTKEHINESVNVNKIVYDIDMIDNLGIADSLSKEYESAKLTKSI